MRSETHRRQHRKREKRQLRQSNERTDAQIQSSRCPTARGRGDAAPAAPVQEVEEERPASKTRDKVDKQKFVHLS